jgi:hypothetical protein
VNRALFAPATPWMVKLPRTGTVRVHLLAFAFLRVGFTHVPLTCLPGTRRAAVNVTAAAPDRVNLSVEPIGAFAMLAPLDAARNFLGASPSALRLGAPAGVAQFGGVPTWPGGQPGVVQCGGVPVWPAGHVAVMVTVVLVLVLAAEPAALVAVRRHAIDVPTSVPRTVYVLPASPLIVAPSASHEITDVAAASGLVRVGSPQLSVPPGCAVPLMVAAGLSVGTRISYAPMSHPPPCGRAKPRWSDPAQGAGMALSAELPALSPSVGVGPPLSRSWTVELFSGSASANPAGHPVAWPNAYAML